jgi:hypothetical protein
MEHNQNLSAPEAATDEPASPLNGRPDPGLGQPPGSRPRPPDEGDLISDQLGRYVPVATDALGRRRRCDGLTPERQCVFLDALSRCGVAADAARAAGISRDTAYELRNSAGGRAFALGWNAAILISRGRMADEVESRALNGVVDKIYRNGALWGERHRHDNRLAMAVLTRLDRQAEGLGEGAAAARVIAGEWDQFLEIVRDGGDGAGDFLATRAMHARDAAADASTEAEREAGLRAANDLYAAIEGFERLFAYSMFGGGLDGEADMTDLEPADMLSWTDNSWERASRGGLLDCLRRNEWPEAVREAEADETDGTCRSRQDIPGAGAGGQAPPVVRTESGEWIPGLARARLEYARRFPRTARRAAPVEQSAGSDIPAPDLGSEGGSG